MTYNRVFFDKGLNRLNTACEKWDDKAACPEGAIPLWVADMDFECAEPIRQAILDRAQHPCYGYTMTEDEDAKALCDFVMRRHNIDIKPEETAMMPCVVTGLRNAVLAFSKEGERVCIFTPVYGPFYFSIEDNGRVVERCELTKDENARYSIDFARFEEILKSGVKLVLLCSPHNPVSRVWTKEELQKVLDLTRAYGATLVADEIHAEFVYAPHRFVSLLELVTPEDKVLCFMSASKTFNIAGLQQAMVISQNSDTLTQMKDELRRVGAACGNIFALCATRAAYTKCDDWLDALLPYLKDNAETLKDMVTRLLPKGKMTPVEATYLAWLDLTAYGMTTEEIMKKAAAHGVAFTGGTFFGKEGDGFVRVNFGCPRTQLEEGMKRLADAINE